MANDAPLCVTPPFQIGRPDMAVAKEKLGTKRQCPNCGARFYDLGNDDPVTCISCEHTFIPEILLKPRRPIPVANKPAAEKPEAEEATAEDAPADGDEDIDVEDDLLDIDDDSDDEDDIESILETDDDSLEDELSAEVSIETDVDDDK